LNFSKVYDGAGKRFVLSSVISQTEVRRHVFQTYQKEMKLEWDENVYIVETEVKHKSVDVLKVGQTSTSVTVQDCLETFTQQEVFFGQFNCIFLAKKGIERTGRVVLQQMQETSACDKEARHLVKPNFEEFSCSHIFGGFLQVALGVCSNLFEAIFSSWSTEQDYHACDISACFGYESILRGSRIEDIIRRQQKQHLRVVRRVQPHGFRQRRTLHCIL
jgi:hypothetical protein